MPSLGLAVLRAAGFLLAMFFAGTRFIPFLLKRIASWKSRELFLIAITAIGLGAGYATYLTDTYALVLATALLTMLLTPFAARAAAPVAAWFGRRKPLAAAEMADQPEHDLHGHVIIAGYGRVGRYAADLMQSLDLPFLVIEIDDAQIEKAKLSGATVLYGDASSPVVLEAAGAEAARLILVTVSTAIDVELIVRQAQQINPALQIVARATLREHTQVLRALGAHDIIQPEFEAGLEMVRQTLLQFEFSAPEIEHLTDKIRRELYQPFQTLQTDRVLLRRLCNARRALEIEWFTLEMARRWLAKALSRPIFGSRLAR